MEIHSVFYVKKTGVLLHLWCALPPLPTVLWAADLVRCVRPQGFRRTEGTDLTALTAASARQRVTGRGTEEQKVGEKQNSASVSLPLLTELCTPREFQMASAVTGWADPVLVQFDANSWLESEICPEWGDYHIMRDQRWQSDASLVTNRLNHCPKV